MPIELKVPAVGESISEVQIGRWLKSEGQSVTQDESLVEIESDKATVELPAPAAGVVSRVLKRQGEKAAVGEVIGYLEPAGAAVAAPTAAPPAPKPQAPAEHPRPVREKAAAQPAREGKTVARSDQQAVGQVSPRPTSLAPAVLEPSLQPRIGRDGNRPSSSEEIVPMSPMRRKIAERLVEAQQNAALLTTFNEIDMSRVIALRNQHKETFHERYGVKLGFMSFFVQAVVDALRHVPQIGAEVRGTDIVYHHDADIGIAVGSGKGLVVPVLRGADRMTFSQIELAIADFGRRAQNNQLKLEELQGGTFTISNGGVYGSLLSTPIVNPPQSGILGLHAIQDRPVAVDGQVVIRPMMYVALTYDHRVVDGREAVTYLRRVKEVIEDPVRLLLDV